MDDLPTMAESSMFLRHVNKLESAAIVVAVALLLKQPLLPALVAQLSAVCDHRYTWQRISKFISAEFYNYANV